MTGSVWVVTEFDCGAYYGEVAALCTTGERADAIALRFTDVQVTERPLDTCFSEGCRDDDGE